MVNEDRLQPMIKMAMFDKESGKECRPMAQYARKDYVTLKLLGSFVTGSIAFALMTGMWALYSMEKLMNEMNSMDIRRFVVMLLIRYVVFMFLYLAATYYLYNQRYTRGRKKVKLFYGNIKRLNQLYEREERLKISDNKEWY